MERAPHKGCDDLYTSDQIRNVYQKCGIPPGGAFEFSSGTGCWFSSIFG